MMKKYHTYLPYFFLFYLSILTSEKLGAQTPGTMEFGSSVVVLSNATNPSANQSVNALLNNFNVSAVSSNSRLIAFANSGNGAGTNAIGGSSDHVLSWLGDAVGTFSSATLISDSGTEFSITAMEFAYERSSGAATLNFTFQGKRDGAIVGTLNLSSPAHNTEINLDFTNPTTGSFSNIDEIVIIPETAITGGFSIDELVIDNPSSSNTDPTISINNTVLAYTEGNTATQIDATATVNDSDGDSDWDGGTLALQITANAEAADELSISDTDGDGTAITISGTNILSNGTVVGNLSASGGIVTNNTILTITFDADATNAIVQEVLQSLRYRNTSTTPGTSNRTITVTATDKNSGSANDARTVSVSSVPTAAPVVTTPSGAITVNAATQTISGTHTKNGVTVHAYVDANNDGTADNAVSLGSATVSGNAWSFSVNLTQDTANNFVVQANDSGDTSSDVDVPTITEDSTSPANPIVTTPSGAVTINADTQTISGSHTENGVTVHAYVDANNDGTADNSVSLGSNTVSGNSWSFSVNLTQNSINNFVVQAEDDAGNTSSDVDISTITETSAITWTGVTSNSWNTASNWNTNSVPVATSDVTIPNGITNYPTISSSVTVNSINIASGASLIANASVTGTTTYSRNLATTNWYLVSAPVSGETQQDVIANHTFATGSGSNIGIGAFTNNGPTPWVYATNATTGPLVSGTGVSMKLAAAGDVSITGSLNTSNVSFPIATGSRNNFNLIGNPYTSFVSSSIFTNANTGLLSEETVWLWDGSQYVTYNAVSPIQIAPAQGFFVEASGSGNVTFSTANQSHQGVDTFMKQAPKTSFELFVSEGKNKKSTKVFFIDGKTKGFDNGYDSKMYGGVNHKFAVFTELLNDNEGKKLAIQTLPNSNIEKMVIPVGLLSDGDKEITFSVNSQNLPSDTQIFLEDRINNKFINLSEEEHTVNLTNASKGIGQFYIHTTAQKLNTPSTSLENVSMYKSDVQEITVTGLRAKANIKVYSILGKEIVNTNINSNGVSKITLPTLASGVYIVKLNSDLGNMSKKIILE
ncbi:T9SS type A sorting domain-containing protein [Tenacibaculum aiptasiae]|uniref:T9SS type A sorting domain-containing protein n=1 Tax=Tenacibaculum aiptasiae TaxID=426481 RepID=UPI003B59CBB2